jgi:hypothetical protein
MSRDRLQLEYCLNKLEARRFEHRAETASALADLDANGPAPGLVRARRTEVHQAKGEAASTQVEQCGMMNERIASVAKKKNLSVAAMNKECAKD